VTYTEELALLRAQQEKRRKRLAEWETHGVPLPGLALNKLTGDISPRCYRPATQAELDELKAEVAEADIEIAEKEAAREQKLSRGSKRRRLVAFVPQLVKPPPPVSFRVLSDDYRSIECDGTVYHRLGPKLALALKFLHQTPGGRTEGFHEQSIRKSIDAESERLEQLFKGRTRPLLGTLVVKVHPAVYRLNVK
jgi:hypothetical protein